MAVLLHTLPSFSCLMWPRHFSPGCAQLPQVPKMPITRERAAEAIKEKLGKTRDESKREELGKLQSWLRRHPDTLEHVPEEDDNDAIVGFLLAEMAGG
jgi:hypothetical protein